MTGEVIVNHRPAFLAASVIIVMCGAALGETIPVSPGLMTIQEAIDAASPGDTVLAGPGVYHEQIDFGGKAITVLSSGGPRETVITPGLVYTGPPAAAPFAIVTFDDGETRDAVLEGFTLRGGWIGILCMESAPTIRRNILVGQNVTDWAAICLAGPGYPEFATTGSAPAAIVNNTIVFCRNGGISTFSTEPPVIRNNIIAFNRHYGIHREGIQPGAAQPDMGYNDVFGSPVLYYEITDPGTGSISLDPMIDRSYGLMPGSPCIDAGDPDPFYDDPDGSRNDMGAVPFGGGSGDHPVPTNEWISVYCASVVSDGDPLPPGTVIEAYDPGGILCGRDRVRNDGTYGFMPIYRDDIYTDADEGAEPGDEISFTVDGAPAEPDPPIYWTASGDVFELCSFSGERCLDIELHEGWNLISWNLAVHGDIDDIIAGIEDCVDVVLGYELDAIAWDPDLRRFSTMRELGYRHGYWLRMNCGATLRICGPEIPKTAEGATPPRPNGIRLYEGWNLAGYWPRETLPVEEGFRNIAEVLGGASGFDHGARVWMPGMGNINTLTGLSPGFGYWVRVESDTMLLYPGFDETIVDYARLGTSGSSSPGAASRSWMLVYGEGITLDGRELPESDVVEFFTEEGLRCGSGVYEGGLLRFTPVYGYDAVGGTSTGLPRDGERVHIRVGGEQVYPSLTWSGTGSRVRLDELTSEPGGDIPAYPSLGQNYPNPFNPSTTISFSLPSRAEVRLSIFTVTGQLVSRLAEGTYPAGTHTLTWDGRNRDGRLVSSGVYLYRLETADCVETRKMIVSR